MINENLIEIKTFVVLHPDAVVAEMAAKVQTLAGNVAVLCDPLIEEQGGILVAPGKYRGSQNSDSGTVIASGVCALRLATELAFFRCTDYGVTHQSLTGYPTAWKCASMGFRVLVTNR